MLNPFLLRDQVLHTNVGAGNHNYLKTGDHFPHPLSKLDILCLSLQILSSPSPAFSVPQDPDICGPHQQASFLSGFQEGSARGRQWKEIRGLEGERVGVSYVELWLSSCREDHSPGQAALAYSLVFLDLFTALLLLLHS